jgi:tetratricopeptide (TPR) repeat protein
MVQLSSGHIMGMRENGLFLCLCFFIVSSACVADTAARQKKARAEENLGTSQIRDGNLQSGLQHLLAAAELSPENAELQNSIGYTYWLLGERERAVIHYKQALQLNPDFPEAENNLGVAYADLKKWDLAIEMFTKASQNITYPARQSAFSNLANAYQQKGELRKALEFYDKAIELFPRNSVAFHGKGFTYEALGEWENAIQAYEKSIEYMPDFPVSHLSLGKLFLKLGRFKEAEKELHEVIRTDSKGTYAQEAKKLLAQLQMKTPSRNPPPSRR